MLMYSACYMLLKSVNLGVIISFKDTACLRVYYLLILGYYL